MSKTPPLPESAQLLDDLESIRALLGDDTLEPPLLTEAVDTAPEPPRSYDDEQIPLLYDEVAPNPEHPEAKPAPVFQLAGPEPDAHPHPEPAAAATTATTATPERNRQDTLLHLDADLRSAAQQIMQDVINDFTPHIETEIRRRLEARMERLLNP
ncbi:DNA polymerase III subunit chi [Pseudomonas typographi]|uniref:DNA polymerase III subunit chi n=1 Tax=Pseudomonas typographi TaxID=2715964 RepID=A0ABR7YXF1_9PSED|nr:DNA polymerase III subunit chi [Pseudomonas typographi]MBD1597883.1 DNA polymerase III subunit chi [Pseudomonas typographi]